MLRSPAQAGKKNKAMEDASDIYLERNRNAPHRIRKAYLAARLASMTSQIFAAMSGPLSR